MKRSLATLTCAVLVGLPGCVAPTRLPDFPTPISNNAVASVVRPDGSWTIYSFMGITDPADPASITPACSRLDEGGAGWRRIADAPRLEGRGKIGASAVSVAGDVYIIGGYAVVDERTEVTETYLYRYDPDADEWVNESRVPVEVDDTLAAVWRDRWIVLVSGWHGPAHDNVPDVQLYDTRTGAWAACTPLPGPALFGHAGGISGDTLLVVGGVTSEGGFAISDAVYTGRLDPADPTGIAWRRLPPHPGRPTYRAAATTTHAHGGPIMILGGTDNPYNISGVGYDGRPSAPLDQLLVFDPASETFDLRAAPGGAVMDLRGLAPLGGDRWAAVGGMLAPETADPGVRVLTLP